jgi:hypothetical protein
VISDKATYQPKGSMCASCAKALENCSGLQFDKMQVMQRVNSVIIVKCDCYKKHLHCGNKVK